MYQGTIILDCGASSKLTFKPGEFRHLFGNEGMVTASGLVRFADGTEHPAVRELDSQSSGEHWGTGIVLEDGAMTWQDEDDFLEKLGLASEQVFPYKYQHKAPIRDIHTGDDGWSR